MFIMFGLVWLSVEQETCPPHVGQFVTLNNRPYQKEPIVVKVKKKKGNPPPPFPNPITPRTPKNKRKNEWMPKTISHFILKLMDTV